MANCPNIDTSKFVGRTVVLALADGCPDARPAANLFKPLGAMTTKSFDLSPNTITSDADDTQGFSENLVTNVDFTISGEGEWARRDKITHYGVNTMTKMYITEVRAGRQPTVWVMFDFGDTVIYGYMVVTGWSGEGATNDFATFSVEFKVADSSSVAVYDDVPVTAIDLTPATASVVVGATVTLTAAFTPTDATNAGFTVQSSDLSKASVTIVDGEIVVTGVAAGTATITVHSNDGNYTDTAVITVTAP